MIRKFASEDKYKIGDTLYDRETGELFEVIKIGHVFIDDKLMYAITTKEVTS